MPLPLSSHRRILLSGLVVLAAACLLVFLGQEWTPPPQPDSSESETRAKAPRRAEPQGRRGAPTVQAPSESPRTMGPSPFRIRERGPRAALAGKVSRRFDGQGIPGAQLTIEAAGPAAAQTDKEGHYRFDDLKPGVVRVRVRAEGYAPIPDRPVSLPPDKPETEANFELVRAAQVEGRVQEAEARPVPGAELWMIDYEAAAPEEIALPIVRNLVRVLENPNSGISKLARADMAQRADRPEPVRSDPDGRFVFSWAPVGRPFTIQALHPSFASGQSSPLTLQEGEAKRDVLIVLQQGASIAGAIRDPDGAAIPGARVAAVDAMAVPQGSFQGLAKGILLAVARQVNDASQSDESGAYLVSRLASGRYRVLAEADRFQFSASPGVELAENEQASGVDLVLKPAAVVSGRVIGPTAAPIPDAYVLTAVTSLENPSYDYATTDQEGRYRLSHLDPNLIHWAVAWADGYGWKLEGWIRPPRENLDFQLDYEASVQGQVVDSATQEPISSFRIQPLPQSVPPQIYFLVGAKVLEQGQNLAIPFQDPSGSFLLTHLAAGDYQLTTWADGYLREQTQLAGLAAGEQRQGLIIQLTPGAAVQGIVIENTEEAKPIPGARVTEGQPRPELLTRLIPEPQNEAIADAAGRFYLAGLRAGKPTTLVAEAPGYLQGSAKTTPSTERPEEVQIKLSRGAAVAGRVVAGADSSPVASAAVFPGGGGLFSNPRGAVQTDSEGRFLLADVSPGTAQLTVRHPDYPEFTTEFFSVRPEGVTDIGEIRLVSPGGIEGFVYGPDQTPIEGVEIVLTVEAASHPTATDRLGYFHFDRVPPGLHQLLMVEKVNIQNRSPEARGAQQVKQVRVESGQTAQADFILFPGVRVYGQVLAGGKPVEKQYSIRARARNPERGIFQEFAADTGKNGAYELRDLPPGSYTLIVSGRGAGAAVVTEEMEAAGQEMRHDIQLPQSGVKGLVVDPAGNPVPGAVVEMSGLDLPGGARPPRPRTDKNGAFEFSQVSPGRYTLVARHNNYGYSSLEILVEEGQSLEGLRIQLRDKVALEGLALFAHLNPPGPVKRLFIRLTDASGARAFDNRVAVDAQGRYKIESLTPGFYRLEAFTFSATVGRILLEAAPIYAPSLDVHGDPHDLVFPPGATLAVVASTEAGQPVRAACVVLMRPDGGVVIFPGEEGARTNDEGLCLLEHTPAGPHVLVVSKDGFAPARVEINLAPGQTASIHAVLKNPGP